MAYRSIPAIDPVKTGRNIVRLRKERGLSVRDIQAWFNFEEPRAIYKWQSGQTLPSVDNLYALSVLLEVPMDSVIVGMETSKYIEPQEIPAAHHFMLALRINLNCRMRMAFLTCNRLPLLILAHETIIAICLNRLYNYRIKHLERRFSNEKQVFDPDSSDRSDDVGFTGNSRKLH